jgi:hypothetical protein
MLSCAAAAENCDVNFRYGVVIDPTHVRLLNNDTTYIQITNNTQLFISGREIILNGKQKALLKQYAQRIRQQVPEIVSIAVDGVDVGLEAVNKVIGGLTGENSDSHQQFQERFTDMQWRLRSRFNQSEQNYYIAPQDFDDFDEIFSGEFEEEIEEIVSQSLGSILMAVGEAIVKDDSDDTENRDGDFAQKMEKLGQDLKIGLSTQTNALDKKVKLFCDNLKQLNLLEEEVRATIPNLNQLDLIENKH